MYCSTIEIHDFGGHTLSLLHLFLHWSRKEPLLLWSWSYGSWISNYMCNQCLSPLTFEYRSCEVFDTTLSDNACQWIAAVRWFSPDTQASSTKTDRHDITEILMKMVLNTINHTYYSAWDAWYLRPYFTFITSSPSLNQCIYQSLNIEGGRNWKHYILCKTDLAL